jgi:hypothetical protein
MVLLDIEKAYDTVWVRGLIYKLITFKFPGYLIYFLHSYLTDRSFAVNISGSYSPTKLLPAGLPQGAVLSPILFTIYTADMPRPPHIHLALFADDTAIYAQSWRTDTISRRIANAVDRLISYFDRWRLKVNISKTDAILFTKRRPRNPTPIQLDGMDIPWSSEVTYLGLRLTSTLNYSAYIRTAAHKAIGNLVQVFPLLANDSTLSVATKMHIYI